MLSNLKIILKSKLFYSFILIIFLIPFVYEKLPIRIDMTQQSSLPQELWITYSDISLEKDYVLFTPPQSKYIANKDVKYLKKIKNRNDTKNPKINLLGLGTLIIEGTITK